MRFTFLPVTVTIVVEIPALDRLITFLKDQANTQTIIDNATQALKTADDKLDAAVVNQKP